MCGRHCGKRALLPELAVNQGTIGGDAALLGHVEDAQDAHPYAVFDAVGHATMVARA